MSNPANPIVHFVARQLPSFAWFSTLRHFDLQFGSVGQVIAGYPEPGRSHLLNSRAFPVAIGLAFKAYFVFAAFTAVAFATNPVHGNSQRAVRFVRDGTERHGSRC